MLRIPSIPDREPAFEPRVPFKHEKTADAEGVGDDRGAERNGERVLQGAQLPHRAAQTPRADCYFFLKISTAFHSASGGCCSYSSARSRYIFARKSSG